MALPANTVSKLTGVLKSCTALVLIDGNPRGTAFFISENQILTCQHVVKNRDEVDVRPYRRKVRKARVVAREPETGLDLALLEVSPDPDEDSQPCVLLDERLDEADYYLAGYPKEIGLEPGLEVFKVAGHPRETSAGALQQLQLEAGKQVTWGLSGGPVLNTATGAVTAVVRSAKDPLGALGGGAIPISRATEAFEQVRQVVKEPPLAVRKWRDALGRNLWQQLGRGWDMHARVDLMVSGARNKWCITTDPTGSPGQYITGRDLGDDVTEAMFRWAQRRRISAREEVDLLGRLLAGALFPSTVASHLKILGNADEVLVRLHLDQDTNLADIPWELAAVPGQEKKFLAANPRYRFVRVVDEAEPPAAPVADAAQIRVLGVVALPPRWKFPTIYEERPYEWPDVTDVWGRLRESIGGAGFELVQLTDAEPFELRNDLETGSFDVLHYVGVGRIGKNGQAQLSMVDAVEGDGTWQNVDEVLAWAAVGGVRMVLLEFTLPPADQVAEAVSPSALGEMIQGSISAVVFTRFPVHPRQFQSFNRGFYRHLGRGESVETAVQLGRGMLEQNKFVEDAACFGWFTLVTGPQSDIRLVQPQPARHQDRSTKRPLEGQPDGQKQGTWESAVVRDEFSR
ncbi:trypsin-like peptidase [Micromonospora kangleipakensis]|uniref:Trypsin-like peptidase n=1 Tax=Micromonospora kangleipakensis TaxID=1077942 RepID=A0A4Q8BCX1_9ACTN|nr:serine protease [Micromonospora kangleipakensis]RZU75498.1 trypsin-like peptidase [Micromonospora kangleipakensis]